MRPILSAKSGLSWLKDGQGTKLCEEIKSLALELLESIQREDILRTEVLTVVSAMSRRLGLLKETLEENGLSSGGGELKLYAQQFIARHSAHSLSLINFSKFLGYSPKYCSRLFKAQTGETFSCYTTRLRIDLAMHLLLETSQPVAIIAELVGFSDSFVFSHFFKRVVGCSPMKFRAEKANGKAHIGSWQPKAKPSAKRREIVHPHLKPSDSATKVEAAV